MSGAQLPEGAAGAEFQRTKEGGEGHDRITGFDSERRIGHDYQMESTELGDDPCSQYDLFVVLWIPMIVGEQALCPWKIVPTIVPSPRK